MKPTATKEAEKPAVEKQSDPQTDMQAGTGGAPLATQEKDPADAQLPAVYSYADDAGAASGFEGADKNDFIIPILDILQAGSPEIVGNLIEGAKAGDFIVRALGEVFDGKKGLDIVFAGRDHVVNEWGKRETGGGLKASHDPKLPAMIEHKKKQPFGKIILPDTNELVETYYLYGTVYREDGSSFRVSVPFWSTKIQVYRGFMTKANGLTAVGPGGKRDNIPMYGHKYRLRSRFVEKKTYKWHGYADIAFAGTTALEARLDPRGDIYQEGMALALQIKKGLVKADMASAAPVEEDGGAGQGGGDAGQGANQQDPRSDKGIPF